VPKSKIVVLGQFDTCGVILGKIILGEFSYLERKSEILSIKLPLSISETKFQTGKQIHSILISILLTFSYLLQNELAGFSSV
jgi:hypothetical protein